ncbi:MAG: flagellar hook-basal body protein [Clostridia bacterium]|nr:flagellar hook-basal body protein [Clostridia bacterium]MDR3645353.1 flagellar hook-basal body protein [Clostridia bacterium]
MLRGITASASGMITQTQRINVLSNDLSNVDTPGFKRDDLTLTTFKDQLIYNLNTGTQIGTMSAGTMAGAETTDLTQGSLDQTGLSTDLALTSGGFFALQGTSGGTEYTRDGAFTVDAQGYLALSTGQRVLGENGPLQVGTDDFRVSSDGEVSVSGRTVGKLAVYNGTATKQADGLFTLTGASRAQATVMQGYLEGSNEDIVSAMTALMASSRAYQSCQEAFKISDQSEQLAVNQVGSLK